MNKRIAVVCGVVAFLVTVTSCSQQKPANTPSAAQNAGKTKMYSGELSVAVDRTLQPILQQEAEVFQFLYDSVQINTTYGNEQEILAQFSEGKAGVLVLARELTAAEKAMLKEKDTIYTLEMKVAYDAVALVANNSFNDEKLDVAALAGYFSSKNKSSTKLVFESTRSSCVDYVLNTLGYREKVSSNVYALKTVEEVIAYVEQNKDAIGFVPYSFLSDTDDERVKQVLKRIKILSLRTQNEKGEQETVSANQSDIASGTYPLIRTVNTVTRYTHTDNLERLFVNFLYKEKGAKIFLKAGLIPLKMPEREINVNTEAVKGE